MKACLYEKIDENLYTMLISLIKSHNPSATMIVHTEYFNCLMKCGQSLTS